MQEKKNTFRIFLERSDKLAEIRRVSLRELAPLMGLSVASLFGYRSGAIPISNKAWRKLEEAEKAAGIGSATDKPPEQEAAHSPQVAESETDRIARLEAQIERLTLAVEKLTEQTANRNRKRSEATSSPSHGGTTQPKRKPTIPKKLA